METYYDAIEDDVLVLVADGGLNHAAAEELVSRVEALADAGLRRIIVDCSKLGYVSSSGLSVLLRMHHRVKGHGGEVKLASVPGLVVQVLAVTRLDKVFAIHPDVARARLAFRPVQPDDAPADAD